MRRFLLITFAVFVGAACASAASLSDLPAEARAAISPAVEKSVAQNSPAGLSKFTLTEPNGADGDEFGISVAIDGNTVVVGGPGKAYVFTKPQGRWRPLMQAAELTPSEPQNALGFGGSVAINGNTIVVGADEASIGGGQYQGAAYVFVEPPNGWTNMTETAELSASDGVTYSGFGWAVAISGDTIVAGAPWGTNGGVGPGIIYEFTEPPTGWTNMTQTAELTITNGSQGDSLGERVALSGNTILASTCACSSGYPPGVAYIFTEPPGGWVDMTQSATLTASDPQSGDAFGYSVSFSRDTAVVGAPSHNIQGSAYIFVEPPQGWTDSIQTARLDAPPGMSNEPGFGISVSNDSDTIIVGASAGGVNKRGAIAFFIKPKGGWTNSQSPQLSLSINFSNGYDYFGNSVGISGETAVAGAYRAPTSQPCQHGYCQAGPGEAFVFTKQ